MSEERDKVTKKDEEPEVEAHKTLKATEDADEEPDVEAHKALKATQDADEEPDVEAHKLQTKFQI